MSIRKIRDLDPSETPCRHPEHQLPNMMCFQPGVYEHECPGCRRTFQFTVRSRHSLKHDNTTGRQDIHYINVGDIPAVDVQAYIERVREGFFIPVRN